MLECRGLGKRYGDRWLFRNLDLLVNPGECCVVQGVNGSGKSTLLKTIAGLIPPTEGSRNVGDLILELGYAALDQPVYPQLTVLEHLRLSGELRGVPHRAEELLEEVGLAYAKDVLGGRLSTGMRARLKFALAVQAEPNTLLLDEPGAGLDQAGRTMLKGFIERRRSTTALVIATNDPKEVDDATYVLSLGS